MFARLISSLAAASLTLGGLACVQAASAQTGSRQPHATRAHDAHDAHLAAASGGLRASLHSMPPGAHGVSAGYGLRASGTNTVPLGGGSALMAESMRTGSLRADIARYNAERAGHAPSSADGAHSSPYPSYIY